jgi:ATP-dependent DNA ligase
MGVIYGEGKKNQFFATFLLGAYLGDQVIPITRIGTGFTDEELQTFTTTFK